MIEVVYLAEKSPCRPGRSLVCVLVVLFCGSGGRSCRDLGIWWFKLLRSKRPDVLWALVHTLTDSVVFSVYGKPSCGSCFECNGNQETLSRFRTDSPFSNVGNYSVVTDDSQVLLSSFCFVCLIGAYTSHYVHSVYALRHMICSMHDP